MAKHKDMKVDRSSHHEGATLPDSDAPRYPHGLKLYLNEETLKKLGVKELPELGDKMMVDAVTEVVSVSEENDLYGHRRDVVLQITEMDLTSGGSKEED